MPPIPRLPASARLPLSPLPRALILCGLLLITACQRRADDSTKSGAATASTAQSSPNQDSPNQSAAAISAAPSSPASAGTGSGTDGRTADAAPSTPASADAQTPSAAGTQTPSMAGASASGAATAQTPSAAAAQTSSTPASTAEAQTPSAAGTQAPSAADTQAPSTAQAQTPSTAQAEASGAGTSGTDSAVPGGTILPGHRVVAYYGAARSGSMGILGTRSPQAIADLVQRRARKYADYDGEPVIPAFELIATVATAAPGPGGNHSAAMSHETVQPYLDVARKNKMLLILDIQPGRADPMAQVKFYESFLLDPNVSLALDPEWSMGPHELPGRVIGSMSPAKINQVSAYLSKLVQDHHLPQKLFVIHQFRTSMVPNRGEVVTRPGLATVFHADGHGGPDLKRETYSVIHGKPPFYNGFKVFFKQDPAMMDAAQVMKLHPRPDLITYQ